MNCCLCSNPVEKNEGTEENPICWNCIETPAAMEILNRGEKITIVTDVQPAIPEAPATEAAQPAAEKNGGNMLTGIIVGVVLAVVLVGGYFWISDMSKTSIVKDALAYYKVQVASVEILQYSTYDTKQGPKLQNIIAQGKTADGNLYRAKVQYMKGRDPGQNGVEIKQGASTLAMGNFYNF